MLAVKLERLSEVTRSVSLLARCKFMFSGMAPCDARLWRFSGLRVYRKWGLRLRTKWRCSRAVLVIFGWATRKAFHIEICTKKKK